MIFRSPCARTQGSRSYYCRFNDFNRHLTQKTGEVGQVSDSRQMKRQTKLISATATTITPQKHILIKERNSPPSSSIETPIDCSTRVPGNKKRSPSRFRNAISINLQYSEFQTETTQATRCHGMLSVHCPHAQTGVARLPLHNMHIV